jgi:hypothetical protein
VGTDGSVGIWHETYLVGPSRCENVDVKMPAFGLGVAGKPVPAAGPLASAQGRTGHGRRRDEASAEPQPSVAGSDTKVGAASNHGDEEWP